MPVLILNWLKCFCYNINVYINRQILMKGRKEHEKDIE